MQQGRRWTWTLSGSWSALASSNPRTCHAVAIATTHTPGVLPPGAYARRLAQDSRALALDPGTVRRRAALLDRQVSRARSVRPGRQLAHDATRPRPRRGPSARSVIRTIDQNGCCLGSGVMISESAVPSRARSSSGTRDNTPERHDQYRSHDHQSSPRCSALGRRSLARSWWPRVVPSDHECSGQGPVGILLGCGERAVFSYSGARDSS